MKKAYYRLSLRVHPDRVDAADKLEATQKFQVLTKINGVLTDKDKKALYDQQGIIVDEDSTSESEWLTLYKQHFKPITEEDIMNFQKGYVGKFKHIIFYSSITIFYVN